MNENQISLASICKNYLGPVAAKFDHYIEIYERTFQHLRNRPINLLEIGVFKGGSLNIWRQYFHPESTIVGIDINPRCAVHNDPDNKKFIRIGRQQDPEFLDALISEFGNFDIVVDDGSHQMDHVTKTFQHLFPKIADSSIYFIEDMQTSYWPRYGGGFQTSGTMIELAKELIDLLNISHWRSDEQVEAMHLQNQIKSIQFFEAVIVLEKGAFKSTRRRNYGSIIPSE
jgi:23S rRNA U2552 (ribose-2'-O)-methylase RlmE/FtsJ